MGDLFIHPLQRRQVDQRGFELEVFVQPSILGHVADAPLLGQIKGTLKDADGARIRLKDIQHHADGRRLARTIGTEEAKDLTRLYGKRDVGHGLCLAEPLGKMGNLYCIHT